MRSRAIVLAGVCLAFWACATEGGGYYDSWTGGIQAPEAGVDAGHHHDAAKMPEEAGGEDAAVEAGDDGGNTVDTGVPETGSTCTLRFEYGSQQCDSCMAQNCCVPDNTCGNDPNCLALIMCLTQCQADPDAGPNCPNACAQQYPQAMNEIDAVSNCIGMSCASMCGGP